jgi:Uma2 family endonuclease
MGLAEKIDSQRYTYADYLAWPEHERWELIEGIPYDMSPAPSRQHQKMTGELFRQFSNYLLEKPCEVYAAPFDVRLADPNAKDVDIVTVVQPDISVICDPGKLDEKGCMGSPDLIIEIVSPATVHKDMSEKFAQYERFGVKEYWIVQPFEKILMVFHLGADGRYGRPDIYSFQKTVRVGILPELEINLNLLEKNYAA